MALRKMRLKILIMVAIVITIFALHKNLSENKKLLKHQTVAKDAVKHEDKKFPQSSKNEVVINVAQPNVAQQNKDIDLSKSSSLHQKALDINFVQKMQNVAVFGDHTKDTVILVVQVHDRVEYFKEFIKSLSEVKDIESATLVISMDKFVPDIDKVIETIYFCRYIKIFFPFAMQLFPNSFPGEDPNDCPRDMGREQALVTKCNNAEHPDMYGHYREVKYVQIKHHWLWKLHMVFSGMRAFKDNHAPVILFEEDYYVVPDMLHCATLAIELKNAKCPRCSLVSLGNYEPKQDYTHSNYVEFHSWSSSKANMGMIIMKDFYNQICDCTNTICEYDDYNWDWSLQAAMQKLSPNKLFTVQFKATRIYHLGTCEGLHAKSKCNLSDELKTIKAKFSKDQLFPETLHVSLDNPASASLSRPNGGWGDLRDQMLCKRYKSLCESVLSEQILSSVAVDCGDYSLLKKTC